MEAPDKIYIQPNAYDRWFDGNKPNDNFVEYIRKDIIFAEIERIQKNLNLDDCGGRSVMAWSTGFKKFLNTI